MAVLTNKTDICYFFCFRFCKQSVKQKQDGQIICVVLFLYGIEAETCRTLIQFETKCSLVLQEVIVMWACSDIMRHSGKLITFVCVVQQNILFDVGSKQNFKYVYSDGKKQSEERFFSAKIILDSYIQIYTLIILFKIRSHGGVWRINILILGISFQVTISSTLVFKLIYQSYNHPFRQVSNHYFRRMYRHNSLTPISSNSFRPAFSHFQTVLSHSFRPKTSNFFLD